MSRQEYRDYILNTPFDDLETWGEVAVKNSFLSHAPETLEWPHVLKFHTPLGQGAVTLIQCIGDLGLDFKITQQDGLLGPTDGLMTCIHWRTNNP